MNAHLWGCCRYFCLSFFQPVQSSGRQINLAIAIKLFAAADFAIILG